MTTARKPLSLNLVSTGTDRRSARNKLIEPSDLDLGSAGRKLWAEVTAEFQFEEAAEIELLKQACCAADRIDTVSKQIKREGLTVQSKNGIRAHPLLKIEHLQRSFLCRRL